MDKPTQEQIQKFWEWCGFQQIRGDFWRGYTQYSHYWQYPDGQQHEDLPDVDLNNLFRYAVPKLIDLPIRGKVQEMLDGWVNQVVNYNKDPALALFWAIWEVINGKEEMTKQRSNSKDY